MQDRKLHMKFKVHQSFFIRKGWLSKGLKAVQRNPLILLPNNSREAMDELGLGANQVVALRYWLQATGLVEKGTRHNQPRLSLLGKLVLENDPYIEEMGTLWALHCNLASAQEDAASWYFFFNEFGMAVFDRDDFTRALERYVFTYNEKDRVALTSLEADFSCILSTYIPHERMSGRKDSPENIIDSPFGDLGLIDVESKSMRTFRKKSANLASLPHLIVLYSICQAIDGSETFDGGNSAEIRLDALLNGPKMPGCIFNLDSVGLLTKLYELQNAGYLRINRTAGLDVVRLSNPRQTKEECLQMYYREIG